ncbi:lysophosphatidylserine lipase ABHD12 isoform X1 [Procambarus clarkii]|uniref:lysophosphatidylserine lipase ABHD12 isoform X1 n=2 Tax=Procambarus clarkii TaxID=6728 RepID=UPI001E678587|nr:lysophosphatidylserine lipase ABHD12-like isoform X1 [Procambarus clarkii]XP_045622933.1 lysophosphatidylserine lipase ABHD12-like isoform X1 [Procambarus clarkii]XP_045622934.1 lysophosphatidylserine lipase ABHD12-like isoform X1 [Procambarus clarkii]XP_045622935.1 lysophosphatidylserine lipase ABHD12-like isoform X1 [Procambarus clarkii]
MKVLSMMGRRHFRLGQHRQFYRILRSTGVFIVITFFTVWVLLPLVFHYSPGLQRFIVFLHTVASHVDFSRPELLGLLGTRNFYLTTDKDVSVGMWHILPLSLVHSAPEVKSDERDAWFEKSLKNGDPIILYLHGNKGSRGEKHRIEMYNVLRQMDYHIITFDYRGYADSSAVDPSEEGLVMDGKVIFNYLLENAGTSPIFVWGHSLGTGVSCHAVSELCRENKCPRGLVLEAPFNNLHDEVLLNPLSRVFLHLPYFDWAFIDPLRKIGAEFQSDKHIVHITCPIVILHAHDDNIVPIELGRKLERAAQQRQLREGLPLKFIQFDAKFGYGHNHISRAPEFEAVIRDFISGA